MLTFTPDYRKPEIRLDCPYNPVTGKEFTGNAADTMAAVCEMFNFKSMLFVTEVQAKELGGFTSEGTLTKKTHRWCRPTKNNSTQYLSGVKPGEKPLSIPRFVPIKDKITGEKRMIRKYYDYYHISQCYGVRTVPKHLCSE